MPAKALAGQSLRLSLKKVRSPKEGKMIELKRRFITFIIKTKL